MATLVQQASCRLQSLRTRCAGGLGIFGIVSLTALIPAAPALAQALQYDFRSVGETTVLYETPSQQGRKLHIVRSGTPVEIVVVTDGWIKVREPGGSISWLEARTLSARRTVIVSAERAQVHAQAAPDSALVFEAQQNVVLEVTGPAQQGWIAVRHPGGRGGFVRVQQVWGL